MSNILDDLIAEGSRNLPAQPLRSRQDQPAQYAEPESTFIRHAAWYEVTTCDCGKVDTHFTGLYEERNHANSVHARRWQRLDTEPEKMVDPVAYTRKYTSHYCEHCTAANFLTVKEL